MESEEVGLDIVNVIELERALLEFFAERLSLTPDASIFRGQLPQEAANGVAIRVDSADAPTEFHEPEYTVQVLGKFDDRDDALMLLNRLVRMAPRYGVTVGGLRLAYLLTFGAGSPYTIVDDGRVKHCVSFNYRCAVQPPR